MTQHRWSGHNATANYRIYNITVRKTSLKIHLLFAVLLDKEPFLTQMLETLRSARVAARCLHPTINRAEQHSTPGGEVHAASQVLRQGKCGWCAHENKTTCACTVRRLRQIVKFTAGRARSVTEKVRREERTKFSHTGGCGVLGGAEVLVILVAG